MEEAVGRHRGREGRVHSDDASTDVPSDRFRAILRPTIGKKCHCVKSSCSHEKRSKGTQPSLHRKLHYCGVTSPQARVAAMLERFARLKEEVNLELDSFARELENLLEIKGASSDECCRNPGWRATLEELQVIAKRSAEMSPDDFRKSCKAVVQSLDESRRRQPPGTKLKQLHVRLLFILSQCTRLLQFQDGGFPVSDHLLGFHQFTDLRAGAARHQEGLAEATPSSNGGGGVDGRHLNGSGGTVGGVPPDQPETQLYLLASSTENMSSGGLVEEDTVSPKKIGKNEMCHINDDDEDTVSPKKIGKNEMCHINDDDEDTVSPKKIGKNEMCHINDDDALPKLDGLSISIVAVGILAVGAYFLIHLIKKAIGI